METVLKQIEDIIQLIDGFKKKGKATIRINKDLESFTGGVMAFINEDLSNTDSNYYAGSMDKGNAIRITFLNFDKTNNYSKTQKIREAFEALFDSSTYKHNRPHWWESTYIIDNNIEDIPELDDYTGVYNGFIVEMVVRRCLSTN